VTPTTQQAYRSGRPNVTPTIGYTNISRTWYVFAIVALWQTEVGELLKKILSKSTIPESTLVRNKMETDKGNRSTNCRSAGTETGGVFEQNREDNTAGDTSQE
jgi:hypothetical protein